MLKKTHGFIKFYHEERGFGFIVDHEENELLYHANDIITPPGHEKATCQQSGKEVFFFPYATHRGFRATGVEPVDFEEDEVDRQIRRKIRPQSLVLAIVAIAGVLAAGSGSVLLFHWVDQIAYQVPVVQPEPVPPEVENTSASSSPDHESANAGGQ